MSTAAVPASVSPSFFRAALRIYHLSLGQMLWSRRTVFMGFLVGGPVVVALILRALVAMDLMTARGVIEGRSIVVDGPVIFGLMIWGFYLRLSVPLLGMFYGTALIADEVEDKTITYLFTRPVSRGAVLIGKYLAYLGCTGLVVLPSVMVVFFLVVPLLGGSIGAAFPSLLKDLGAAGDRAGGLRGRVRTGRCLVQAAAVDRIGLHLSLGADRGGRARLHEAVDRVLLPAGVGAARDAAGRGRDLDPRHTAGLRRGALGDDQPRGAPGDPAGWVVAGDLAGRAPGVRPGAVIRPSPPQIQISSVGAQAGTFLPCDGYNPTEGAIALQTGRRPVIRPAWHQRDAAPVAGSGTERIGHSG